MITRDPLTTPQPGDIVRAKDGRARKVLRVAKDTTGRTFVDWNNPHNLIVGGAMYLPAWRSWCRRNEAVVVEVGVEA